MAIDISEIVAACGLIETEDSRGTGYLVSENRAATCAHVVEGAGEVAIAIDFNGIKRFARVRSVNRKSDCALLILEKPLQGVRPLPLGGQCKWKAPWDAYGFPESGKGAGVTMMGIVSNPNAQDDLKASVLELTSPEVAAGMASPLHGFSGSPVLVDGVVVGHLKRYLPDFENPGRPAYGKVYATHSACVLRLLGGESTRPGDDPPPVDPPPSGSPSAVDDSRRVRQLLESWSATKEARLKLPKGTGELVAAEALIQLGEPGQALTLLKAVPPTLRVDQLRALALAKTKVPENIDASIEILKKLRRSGHLDEETGGILAGRYKQKWQETGNKRFLEQSFNVYRDTFKLTKDYYPGINAAATALWLKKPSESKRIARMVLSRLEKVPQEQMDHWQLATKGEAYLLIGELDKAKKSYGKAVERCAHAKGSVQIMQQQARLDLKVMGLTENAIDDVFRLG